ncbi:hypothetical protein H4R18_002753 [Coemansia javaensis]|uniref:Uncharacterized protein n=1 Tax=Coemansia javaensis TaxID=2761396 RepID=A0A9W8HHH2_9FUNG|nr:hypothetical protein H4R18_002753 [Coemansia javaensis]
MAAGKGLVPQTPEQSQAIQSLVQELQRTSPQLFSSLAQPGGQQLAIALPQLQNTAAALAQPSAQPAPQTAQPAPTLPTGMAPFPAGVLPTAATGTAPTAAGDASVTAEDGPTTLSFALNALFRTTGTADNEASSDTVPFGLHFDTAETELGALAALGPRSSSGEKHHTVHHAWGASASESEDEWAGLDSGAAGRPPAALAAVGMALLCIAAATAAAH